MITVEGQTKGKPVVPLLLSRAEVAQMLNVSEQHIWNLSKRGVFRTIKVGARALIPRADVEKLLNGK